MRVGPGTAVPGPTAMSGPAHGPAAQGPARAPSRPPPPAGSAPLHSAASPADNPAMVCLPPLRGILRRDDSGFTLVEAIVSLVVLGSIFTALAYAATGSLRASMVSRVEQQALDFATEALESSRDADYESLAHVASDLTSDPRVVSCGTQRCIDPGTGTLEPLVIATSGGMAQHVEQVDLVMSNHVPITLSTYVTEPADATADYKRVTVVASWQSGTVARERVVSSLVVLTQRGLPLPVFKLTPVGATSTAVHPGATVPFLLKLTNQGAPDRWNLTFSGAAASEWTLYRDDGDGEWEDATTDIPLVNSNPSEDLIVDTGRIDPTASVALWVVRAVPDPSALGDQWTTITATSVAQEAAASGVATLDMLVRVVDPSTPVTGSPGGGAATSVPGAPENLLVTTGDGWLAATWQPPTSSGSSAITDYVVAYKLASSATWTTYSDGVSTTTSVTIPGLANGSLYDIRILAENSAGIGTTGAVAQGMPESGTAYVAPVICPAGTPAPTGSAASGYTLRQYSLHNRSAANPTWPGTGTIQDTSTTGQGLPLIAAVDGPQVPVGTNLPVYSSNVAATEKGRVVLSGGSFLSSDSTRVVDWRSTTGGKAYKGTTVLRLWVAPVSSDDPTLPMHMKVQLYVRTKTGTLTSKGPVVSLTLPQNTFGGASGCAGWQEVWASMIINQSSTLASNEYLGVRVWNPAVAGDGAASRYRLAYDVAGDFPASLIVPEKP